MEGKKRAVVRPAWYAPKGVTTVQGNEAVLNMQESAEAIVAER